MKLFSTRTRISSILLASIVTSLIGSTAGAAVTPAESTPTDRCGTVVGSAAVARVAAVFAKENLDPTRIVIEIPRRMLLKSSRNAESWRVALRVRWDDGQVLERAEVLAFDEHCQFDPGALSPQS